MISYTYSPTGDLESLTDGKINTVQWTYDQYGRVFEKFDANSVKILEYDYDANGALTSRWSKANAYTATTRRASADISYPYNAVKQLASMTEAIGTTAFTYAPNGNLATEDGPWANDTVTYGYNTADRLSQVSVPRPGETGWVQTFEYVYNQGNQRIQQTRTDGSYVDYTYDDLGQLESARAYTSGGSSLTGEWFGYDYDPAWNLKDRTNGTSTVTTFTVNNNNELTGNYSYDDNGNMILDAGSIDYLYDDENQLVEVADDLSSYTKAEYVYDGKMRSRIRREYAYNLESQTWDQVSEKRYIYDGSRVLQERVGVNEDSSFTADVIYTRGPDLSGSLEGAGGIGGLLARTAMGRGWFTLYYHADGNGNITSLISFQEAVAVTYRYDPYGNVVSSSGFHAAANTYRFSSKEVEPLTGQYYYGYRFYDPYVQRWLNRDPIGVAGRNQFVRICV